MSPATETPLLSVDDKPAEARAPPASRTPLDPPTQACGPPVRKGGKLWIPALLAALIVLGLWVPNMLRPPPPAWTVYASTKGQIRRVVLGDQSVLRLNGASSAKVVFEDADRRAALGQAEAAFLIAPSGRPFLISAGDREARMDGGELNILRQTTAAGAVTVLTVRHGRAKVYPVALGEQAGVIVRPGQQVSWADGQPLANLRAVNANNAFAWETRQLAYDKAPLGEVIADLNRYVARPIRLADPRLASMPFSGILTLEGEEGLLRKMEMVLPLQDQTLVAEIVLRRLPPCGYKNCDKPAKHRKPNALVQSLLKLDKPLKLTKPLPAQPAKPPAPPSLLPTPPPAPSPGPPPTKAQIP
jgi:transmembrane sensor